MTTILYPATEKQVAFLASLLAQREIADELREEITAFLPTADKSRTSEYIDRLLKAPKKAADSSAFATLNALFEGIPNARYAIPAEQVDLLGIDLHGNSLLFVEVKTWQGRTYMRRLHGSVGGFTRTKMPLPIVEAIAKTIASDPYGYTRKFGEHYSCCGKCGAELTDDESRRLMLGPVCRKAFRV